MINSSYSKLAILSILYLMMAGAISLQGCGGRCSAIGCPAPFTLSLLTDKVILPDGQYKVNLQTESTHISCTFIMKERKEVNSNCPQNPFDTQVFLRQEVIDNIDNETEVPIGIQITLWLYRPDWVTFSFFYNDQLLKQGNFSPTFKKPSSHRCQADCHISDNEFMFSFQ